MRIFLDTNIFFNNWFLKSANFQYLLHFINNEEHTLLLSNLVLEEVNNIRNRQVASSIEEMEASFNKLKKLNYEKISFSANSLGISEYDLLNVLNEKTEGIELIDYEKISHKKIVSRLFKSTKPFAAQEKGYRDTLIWLSLLQYIQENSDSDEVIFITENSSDFFSNDKKDISLHKDLLKDIEDEQISVKISPFKNLHEFVKTKVDKNTHSFDHSTHEELFEEYLESESTEYLASLDNNSLSLYLQDSIFQSKVSNILGISVEILEGFEDNSIEGISEVDDDKLYIAYEFNFRRVFIQIEIPYPDYIANKEHLDTQYIIISKDEESVIIEALVRPYFDVSFIYSPESEKMDSFSVNNLWLRR